MVAQRGSPSSRHKGRSSRWSADRRKQKTPRMTPMFCPLPWAEARGVTQEAFKPDWTKHAKAAPFKRNDAMLNVLPVGVLVFPGNGIQENLADKAKKLGIPVVKFEKGA